MSGLSFPMVKVVGGCAAVLTTEAIAVRKIGLNANKAWNSIILSMGTKRAIFREVKLTIYKICKCYKHGPEAHDATKKRGVP